MGRILQVFGDRGVAEPKPVTLWCQPGAAPPRRILIPNVCRKSWARIRKSTAARCERALPPSMHLAKAERAAGVRKPSRATEDAIQAAFGSHLAARVTQVRVARRTALQREEDPSALPSSYGREPETEAEAATHRINPRAEHDAATSLDYSGISDPLEDSGHLTFEAPRARFLAGRDGQTRAGVPMSYLSDVERETELHRVVRSRAHDSAAALAARGLRRTGLAPDQVIEAITPRVPVSEGGRTKKERITLAGAGRFARAKGQERIVNAKASMRSLRWHQGRSRGALERFQRVIDCGSKRVHVSCGACDCLHEVPDRCACPRLCLSCREAARRVRLAGLAGAQERVREAARRGGLFNPYRKGGAWDERMVTLTIPHFGSDESAVKARIDVLLNAWRAFTNRLRQWAREVVKRPIAWYRAFEWTPGNDELGHPHFHVWLFSPFLPVKSVQRWWRAALAAEGVEIAIDACMFGFVPRSVGSSPRSAQTFGFVPRSVGSRPRSAQTFALLTCAEKRPLQGLPACLPTDARAILRRMRSGRTCVGSADVIVDVRRRTSDAIRAEAAKGRITLESSDGRAIQKYIEGWSIIDAANGGRVPARIIARLYEALEGRRLVAKSDHLFDPRKRGCIDCGALGWARVTLIDPLSAFGTPNASCSILQGAAVSTGPP